MMNDFAETRAFAKVNLTLDVLKKRADGYHELSTVMQTIDLYDELYADFSHEDIAVTADFDLPEGSVAYRAAHEYARRTGCGGAHIKIRAHIPEMAGLGGSSADGAGVLRLMQRRYGAMSGAELYSLAAEMSGSGSACFGIFETLAQAQRAAETFCDMAFCHACAGIGNTEQM